MRYFICKNYMKAVSIAVCVAMVLSGLFLWQVDSLAAPNNVNLVPRLISELLAEEGSDIDSRARRFKDEAFGLYAERMVEKAREHCRNYAPDMKLKDIESALIQYMETLIRDVKLRPFFKRGQDKEIGQNDGDTAASNVLILVHTGRGYDRGDTMGFAKIRAEKMIANGLFNSIVEIEQQGYPSYLDHHGQVLVQIEDEVTGDEFMEKRKAFSRGKVMRQSAADDYSFGTLEGKRFVLAGGGFDMCHRRAYKQLLKTVKRNIERTGRGGIEVVLPADAIYYNRSSYEGLMSYSIQIDETDLSGYIEDLRLEGFSAYKVVKEQEGRKEIVLAENIIEGQEPDLVVRLVEKASRIEDEILEEINARNDRIDKVKEKITEKVIMKMTGEEVGAREQVRTRQRSSDMIEQVIEDVSAANRRVEDHLVVRSAFEGDMHSSNIVVLLDEDILPTLSLGAPDTIMDKYNVMKSAVRKKFNNGNGLEEFQDAEALEARAEELLREGKRVIILSDSSMDQSNINALEEATGKDNGLDFCVLSVEEDPKGYNSKRSFHFVNLWAMALMGTAMMEEGLKGNILFDQAYELFSGGDAEETLFEDYKKGILAIISISPRMVILTDAISDRHEINRLFSIAA